MKTKIYKRLGKEKPEVIVIPVEHGQTKESSSYFEKLVFYRDTSRPGARLLVVSRDIVEEIGGFDPSLGFGEDRLFQENIFKTVQADKKTMKEFEI